MPGEKSKNTNARGDNEEAATDTDQPSSIEPTMPEEASNNPIIVNNGDPNDLGNGTAATNDTSGEGNNREANIVTDQEQEQNIVDILDNLDIAEQDQPSSVEPFLMEEVRSYIQSASI